LEVAPGIEVAMAGRLAEQALGPGPAFAEGVLDDLDAEHALAHGHGDLGFGLRCFAHAGAAGVGDPETAIEPLEEGRQEVEHLPLLSVSGWHQRHPGKYARSPPCARVFSSTLRNNGIITDAATRRSRHVNGKGVDGPPLPIRLSHTTTKSGGPARTTRYFREYLDGAYALLTRRDTALLVAISQSNV